MARRTQEGSAFGDLRSVLAAPASTSGWNRLCAILKEWEPERISDHLAYIEESLSSWPHRIKRAPIEWIESARRGEAPPHLRCASTLTLSGHRPWSMEALDRLADALTGADVRRVEVRGACVRGERFWKLVERCTESMEHIEQIHCVKADLGVTMIEHLGHADVFKQIRSLHIEREAVGRWGLSSIVEAHRFANLEYLGLRDTMIEGEETDKLWEARWLKPSALNLDFNRLGAPRHSLSGLLENVDTLSLSGISGDDDPSMMRTLLSWATPGRLTSLDMSMNGLSGAQGLALLNGLDTLAGVESLVMSHNPIGDDGLALLIEHRYLKSVTRLELDGCDLSDEGIMTLIASPLSKRLISLSLGRNSIGERARRALLATPHLRSALSCHEEGLNDGCSL